MKGLHRWEYSSCIWLLDFLFFGKNGTFFNVPCVLQSKKNWVGVEPTTLRIVNTVRLKAQQLLLTQSNDYLSVNRIFIGSNINQIWFNIQQWIAKLSTVIDGRRMLYHWASSSIKCGTNLINMNNNFTESHLRVLFRKNAETKTLLSGSR